MRANRASRTRGADHCGPRELEPRGPEPKNDTPPAGGRRGGVATQNTPADGGGIRCRLAGMKRTNTGKVPPSARPLPRFPDSDNSLNHRGIPGSRSTAPPSCGKHSVTMSSRARSRGTEGAPLDCLVERWADARGRIWRPPAPQKSAAPDRPAKVSTGHHRNFMADPAAPLSTLLNCAR